MFKFDFTGINWSKDDPVSIVNAYREALQRQEQQKKRRLLEGHIGTNGSRAIAYADSSATLSPTTGSASESDGRSMAFAADQSGTSIGNKRRIVSDTVSSDSQQSVSQIPSHDNIIGRSAKYGTKSFMDSRTSRSRISNLLRRRRNFHKYNPPAFFTQIRKPGERIKEALVLENHEQPIEHNDQSTQAVVESKAIPTSQVVGPVASNSRNSYVDRVTQTDILHNEDVALQPKVMDLQEIAPERRKRPGYFSADFDDSDTEPPEPEVQEPTLKKRRLFTNDVAFRWPRTFNDSSSLVSPRKIGVGESDLARRKLELDRQEQELRRQELEEQLERERLEKEKELERQRKELDEERKRQEQKRKELEEKERQLQAQLSTRMEQANKPEAPIVSTQPFSSGAQSNFDPLKPVPDGSTSALSSNTGFGKTGFSFAQPTGPSPTENTVISSVISNGKRTLSGNDDSALPERPKFQFGANTTAASLSTSAASSSSSLFSAEPGLSAIASSSSSTSTPATAPALPFQFPKAAITQESQATEGPKVPPFSFSSTSTAPSSSATASFGSNFTSTAPTLSLPEAAAPTVSSTSGSSIPSFSFGAPSTSGPPIFGQSQSKSDPQPASVFSSAPSATSFNFASAGNSGNPASVFGFGTQSAAPPRSDGFTIASSQTTSGPSSVPFNFAPSTADPSTVFGFGSPAPSSGTSSAPVATDGSAPSNNIFASPAASTPTPNGRKFAPLRTRPTRRR